MLTIDVTLSAMPDVGEASGGLDADNVSDAVTSDITDGRSDATTEAGIVGIE